MKREAGGLPGRSKLSTADVRSPSKHMKKGMRSRNCGRPLGRNEEYRYSNQPGPDASDGAENYTCMKKTDPWNNICSFLTTHRTASADWTTLRYRHSSLYLQMSERWAGFRGRFRASVLLYNCLFGPLLLLQ